MKINLESGRRAKNEELEDRLKRFTDLMNLEVKSEDVTCATNVFSKRVHRFI